jgi:hypothetical protein
LLVHTHSHKLHLSNITTTTYQTLGHLRSWRVEKKEVVARRASWDKWECRNLPQDLEVPSSSSRQKMTSCLSI